MKIRKKIDLSTKFCMFLLKKTCTLLKALLISWSKRNSIITRTILHFHCHLLLLKAKGQNYYYLSCPSTSLKEKSNFSLLKGKEQLFFFIPHAGHSLLSDCNLMSLPLRADNEMTRDKVLLYGRVCAIVYILSKNDLKKKNEKEVHVLKRRLYS